MNLPRFFVAIGIGLLLTSFLNSVLAAIYKKPDPLVYYIILAILGIGFIILGFMFIQKISIGSGFILGGILILLFANFFASISLVMSTLLGSMFSGITGFATYSGSNTTQALPYLNMAFLFIGLIVLILFANFKLEKDEGASQRALRAY